MTISLFVLGAAVGSFLNVVALRYDPDRFLLDRHIVGGRSHCPACGARLRWLELIPLLSFVLQGGRCRRCRARLSFQYPLVELVSGLIFVFVPQKLTFLFYLSDAALFFLTVLWIFALLTIFLISLIDARLRLIPDEASIFLGLVGFSMLLVLSANIAALGYEVPPTSFLGHYALLFPWHKSPWLNHLAGSAFALLFFAFLIGITRGRGMGLGDLKLGAALGFLFGFPDIILLLILAFVIGSFVGLLVIASGTKTLKSFLPFGPFLGVAAALTFFFGGEIMATYFRLFPF